MSQTHRGAAPLLSAAERAGFLARVRPGVSPEDYGLIEAMSYALPQIVASIEQERMTMRKLRHLLFGAKTEQTDRVCPPASPPALMAPVPTPKRQGHGRIKAKDYTGARWVEVPHPALKPGCLCPLCAKGAVRTQKIKAIVLRLEGAPPIAATGYELARLRCDTCGAVFTAPVPAAAGQEKYAPSVGVTIAVFRYGTGVPHYLRARPATNSEHLFVGHTTLVGRPLSGVAVSAAMERAYRRCGFPWGGTHRLRRCFATRLYARGANRKEIADLLGHRLVTTTERYAQVDVNGLAALVRPWPT
jgi:hypothetical protein